MHTKPQLSRYSIRAAVCMITLTVSACTDGSSNESIATAVDNYCQNEQQLTPGTAEYEKCISERTALVEQAIRRGTL